MNSGSGTIEIDDHKSIDENLGAYAAALMAADADLAAVLIPRLADWSRNKSLDHDKLWDDLLKAVEPAAVGAK